MYYDFFDLNVEKLQVKPFWSPVAIDEMLPVLKGKVAMEPTEVQVSPQDAESVVLVVAVSSRSRVVDFLVQVVVVGWQGPGTGRFCDDSVTHPCGITMPISRGSAHSIGTLHIVAHWAALVLDPKFEDTTDPLLVLVCWD